MRSVRYSAIAVLLVAAATTAAAQQPEKKPEHPPADTAKAEAPKTDSAAQARIETRASGDVTPATATQLLGAIGEASASATALGSATITDVRVVGSADVLDAAGSAALGLLITKHDADLARLRQATAESAPIKSALQAANVPNDRVIGVAINGSVATVFHRSQ